MDCCKADLIDAEHCSGILNERKMKQVDAWQPTSAERLLFFFFFYTIALLEGATRARPQLFSCLLGTVCHRGQMCVRHLHGDLIWIIARRKWSEYSTLNLNIFHFFCLIKLHVSLNLNCFFREPAYVIWFAIFSGNGIVLLSVSRKVRQGNMLSTICSWTFNAMEHSSKDSRIIIVKEREKLNCSIKKEHCFFLLNLLK